MIFINNEALHSFSLKDENVGLRLLCFMAFYAGKKISLSAESDQLFEKSWIKNF